MIARGNFIANRWVLAEGGEVFRRENPSRPDEEVFGFHWHVDAVDQAVAVARGAQPAWDRAGQAARVDCLARLREALAGRQEELARAISLEMGKPLWEARGEAKALVAKIDIMTGEGLEVTAAVHPDRLDGGSYRYRPLGVLAVLGPFNFPLHLANGHIVPALATGNTVVVKPSENAPSSMQLYFECVEEAAFPPGVINMVQGPGPVGARLAAHEDVDGVLFTGSWETGLRIKEATLAQPGKLLALEMGGKNTSILLPDADLQQAATEILQASCLTTGQRCSATSRVVVHREVAAKFTEVFRGLLLRVTTGDPLEGDGPFMGPLATQGGYEGFVAAQMDDEDGKLEVLLEGGARPEVGPGYFVRPGLWRALEVDPRGSHQGREIFGPDVVIYEVGDDAEAVAVANGTNYGLAMSVFTADEERFDELSYELKAGILNLNRSTVGASSRLPFGGVKKSGNHRPAAILAGLYCTYPQATLRVGCGAGGGAAVLDRLR